MLVDGDAEPALREQLRREQGLVQQHRAVRDHHRVDPVAEHRAVSDAESSVGSSMRRGEGPMASLIATLSSASSTAQRRSLAVSSAFAGWTIVSPGSAPRREMSRTDWWDLPGPAGISPA